VAGDLSNPVVAFANRAAFELGNEYLQLTTLRERMRQLLLYAFLSLFAMACAQAQRLPGNALVEGVPRAS
jgi:hypothetical protein